MGFELTFANISRGTPGPDDARNASKAAGMIIRFLGGKDTHKTRRDLIFRGSLSLAAVITVLGLLYRANN